MTFDNIGSFPDFAGRKCRMQPIGSRLQDDPARWWIG
jgi:hypothetical protein